MNKILKIIILLIVLALIGAGIFFLSTKNKTYTSKIEINSEKTDVEKEADGSTDLPQVGSTPSINSGQEDSPQADKTNMTNKTNNLSIISNLVNFGFEKKENRTIDTIIIHSSYDALGDDPYDVSGLIKEYKEYGVAPHYLIDRQGTVYLLVEEKNVAYHAGVSEVPDGRSGVNAFSIGIEMMNTKNDQYTKAQYDSLKKLLTEIKSRYNIKYVLGHKDISPERKDDPWNFNSDKL